jgi:hypothetical protein
MPSKWNVLTPLVDGFEDDLLQLEGQAGRTLSTAEKAKVLQIEREGEPGCADLLLLTSPIMTSCSRKGR